MATVADSVVESRENIPLNKRSSKGSDCWNCNEEYLSGAKFINIAFGVLTIIITIALLLQIYYGDYQVIPHGSVATDSLDCSRIGTSILKKGGNAVDAAIASAFCTAAVTPHLTSLDAGGQMLIYDHRLRTPPDLVDFSGPNAVSDLLPRMVLGLAYIHQQYGSVPWKFLVKPAAELARKGFLIPKMLVEAIFKAKAEDLYGRLEPGQMLQLETLSATLQEIANIPEDVLYKFITEINRPIHTSSLGSDFNGYDIFVPDAPSIGPIFLSTLEEVSRLNFSAENTLRPEYPYRLAQLIQKVYIGLNVTSTFHQGTSSNIAVMDRDDSYVSFTSGLYSLFGSGEMTSAGYILDTKVKDKSCTRLPLVITDKYMICGRRLLFGANDIPTASQLIMYLLVANQNVTDSVEAPRFHMLSNGSIGIEERNPPPENWLDGKRKWWVKEKIHIWRNPPVSCD